MTTSFIIYGGNFGRPEPLVPKFWGHVSQLNHQAPTHADLWVWTEDFGYAYFPKDWLKYPTEVMDIPTPSVGRPLAYLIPYEAITNLLRKVHHLENCLVKS